MLDLQVTAALRVDYREKLDDESSDISVSKLIYISPV